MLWSSFPSKKENIFYGIRRSGKLVKQTTVVNESDKEEITPQTILKRFELYNDFISKIRQQNITAGLDNKRNNDFVPQSKLLKQEAYEKFIKQSTSRSGKWNTVTSLQDQGVLSDLDLESFEGKEFPSFSLNRLTRLKNQDGKEYLERMFTINSLTREGNAIHKTITEIDYYHRPVINHEIVPENPDNQEGKQIHVSIMPSGGIGWGQEPRGMKVQLLEYSEDMVHSILKDIPPIGSFSDVNNGCGLMLVKVGETHDATGVKSLAEFVEPFDIVWQKHMSIPGGNVDIKQLVAELQKQSAAAGEKHGAYQ